MKSAKQLLVGAKAGSDFTHLKRRKQVVKDGLTMRRHHLFTNAIRSRLNRMTMRGRVFHANRK